jgi:hypothetical protein
MAKFLNTSGTTFYLEELIKATQQHLMLISPYLQINTRIRQLIEDANYQGIEIDFVYGKSNLNPEETKWLSMLDNVSVRFCENLHAKCYVNEFEAIITSMNLYEFSQVNNNEIGIVVDKESDEQCYIDAKNEALRLCRISTEQKPRVVPKVNNAVFESREPSYAERKKLPPEELYEKLTTAKMANQCNVPPETMFEYFVKKGYLELRGQNHYLTARGKEIGGEFRKAKFGSYFLWPKIMLKKFRS